jgi:hypothetical protein
MTHNSHNQDWISPEEKLLDDLSRLQIELGRVSSGKFNAQRYEPNLLKERNMDMSRLRARTDKAEERRLNDQDAVDPAARKEQQIEEIERALGRLMDSCPPMTDQRSSGQQKRNI